MAKGAPGRWRLGIHPDMKEGFLKHVPRFHTLHLKIWLFQIVLVFEMIEKKKKKEEEEKKKKQKRKKKKITLRVSTTWL